MNAQTCCFAAVAYTVCVGMLRLLFTWPVCQVVIEQAQLYVMRTAFLRHRTLSSVLRPLLYLSAAS